MGEPAGGQDIAGSLRLADVKGEAYDPSALAGNKALVMFWSTSCATCLDELPEIQKVADAGGCEVVTVVVKGAPDQAEEIARQLGVRVPVLMDSDRRLRRMLEINATPTTFSLGPDGRARRFVRGGYGHQRLARLCDS